MSPRKNQNKEKKAEQSLREAYLEGYQAAMDKMAQKGLSCCCSQCTKHNLFVIDEAGKMLDSDLDWCDK